MDFRTIQELERSAYDAWPAAEVHDLGGWRLRATGGVTRRANSVWTGAYLGDLGLDERIEYAQGWYAWRRLPATFQISACSCPPELDAELGARGYRVDAPVSIQIAPSARVAGSIAGAVTGVTVETGVTVRVERRMSAAWFELSAHRGRFAATAEIYRALLERIGDGARFALAEVDGRPAAVGLGVVGQGRMGIFSMLTVHEARRRGAGRAVLSALAGAALEASAPQLYLQVERNNAPARALYRAASFAEAYGYHYRVITF
jgi:N-acetylglutamate synthase